MRLHSFKKTDPNHPLMRFFIVGGINTLFGYSLYSVLLFIGFHYSLATAVATVGGVLFNYQTTRKWVFKQEHSNRLFAFIVVYLFLYLVNITALAIFHYFQINLYLAGAVLILPIALLGFVLNSYWVFPTLNQER